MSFILAVSFAIPLVYTLLQNEKSIFSEAARTREKVEIADENTVPYPTEAPEIIYVTRFYGKMNDSIVIFGKNFGRAQKASKVFVGDVELGKTSTLYWSDDEIEVTLPSISKLLRVGVNINNNSAFWKFKLNGFDDLTKESLFINYKENFIRTTDSSVLLKVYYAKLKPVVYGTTKVEFIENSVPEDFLQDTIVNVEMFKNDSPVNFKVLEQRN